MKTYFLIRNTSFTILVVMILNCVKETPINSNIISNLKVDTLLINNLNFTSYSVPPNLASNERLYLGEKDGINIPFSFIRIGPSFVWEYYNDSTVSIDSVQFKLYLIDSSKSSNVEQLQLFFSPDSYFNENQSTYLDYEGFSTNDWYEIGSPSVVHISDSIDAYSHSELIWNIDSLMHLLSDSGITRTFSIEYTDNDSNYIELFSEEATTGDKDPKVVLFYRKIQTFSTDSTSIDTSSHSIFSSADLSIFDPTNSQNFLDKIGINNGAGKRIYFTFPFGIDSLKLGSIIRSANLVIPIDSSEFSNDFKLIIDPIQNDSSFSLDSANSFTEDPFEGVGYPYRLSNSPDSLEFLISMKNILQNISLGNIKNNGFKIVSEEKNNPFESIWFLLNGDSRVPEIEILYVSDED